MSWLWPSHPPSLERERRAAPRLCAVHVKSCLVIALHNHVPLKVRVRDLSASGIGLINEFPLKNGTFLVIALRASQGFEMVVRAQIVHATEQGDGSWLLGCSLSRPLAMTDLDAFQK